MKRTLALLFLFLFCAAIVAGAQAPKETLNLKSGELAIALRVEEHGAGVASVLDTVKNLELCPAPQPALFEIEFANKLGAENVTINSGEGWTSVTSASSDGGALLTFFGPVEKRVGDVTVRVSCKPRAAQSGFDWRIEVDAPGTALGLWKVKFPQVAVGKLGGQAFALVPIGPGQLRPSAGAADFSYNGSYSTGWCSVPIMGVFDEPAETGLYCAVHDEWGSRKDLKLESSASAGSTKIIYTEPVPNMGEAPGSYKSSGDAVWQLVRGGWWDAAMIYKQWARDHAKWWPSLGKEGREDTVAWMRELSAWAQTGGSPAECVQQVKDFQQYLGVPCGFHWYNWHQIPFDNDYPHYFPPKEGFAEAVADLQQNNVFVMPYINGRLWDTRDKGVEDFEFTSKALPAVTKQPDGKPITETYGSKEADGSPVRLGVMCPTTPLWQSTVRDIVLRLQNECGTRGVYIDQIAAAEPALCMDKTHGHPLGGGHWWNEGYWKLLDGIRGQMGKDKMITTECNAETYIRWLDGYLTWHWQYDGMVPVFPAIYGGTVQMFGRAYGGGDTKDLALRMRAAQQLVFGEQIGWLGPKAVLESPSKDFFRQTVRVRDAFRRYFYAGEMARPPQLKGDMQKVKADWQWGGVMWVTTDAVLAGAWQLPAEKKTVLLFANVSEAPVTVDLDLAPYCPGTAKTTVQTRDAEQSLEKFEMQGDLKRAITVPPLKVLAWEVAAI